MITRSSAFALACLSGLSFSAAAAEFVSSDHPQNPVPSATDNLSNIPRNAYTVPPAVGLPYRSLFRDTKAPYWNSVRNLELTPSAQPAETLGVRAHVALPNFRGSFPLLQRGFAPEEADLKLGPLYFKLRHLSTSLLFSDNLNHSHDQREQGCIGIATLGAQIMAQLTEGFHISVAGNLVYLPFEGEGGVAGFALRAPYSFGLTSSPNLHTQITWEPVAFGLPLIISDEFRVGLARYADQTSDNFELFEGFDFNQQDRGGIYTFRAPRNATTTGSRDRSSDLEFLYYSNEIGLGTGGPLPGQNVFRFHASHEDLWYIGEQQSKLPSARDHIHLGVESVRESLRFKPFASYNLYHADRPNRLDHTVWSGVKGPITDLMHFRAQAGYIWQTIRNVEIFLWRVGLHHTPNPRTTHSLTYSRDVSDFHDDISQQVLYQINKTIGPNLFSTAYVGYAKTEASDEGFGNRNAWRTGLRFSYLYSPRTSFGLSGQFSRFDRESLFGVTNAWKARFECSHSFSERLSSHFIYQYSRHESDQSFRNYYENTAYLSMSWLFH